MKKYNGLLSYSNKINNFGDKFSDYGGTLADAGLNNLLRYGEISESDIAGNLTNDIAMSYGKAQQAQLRNMSRMGINPNSGRYQGMAQDYMLQRAAAEAGARNRARMEARRYNNSAAGNLLNAGANFMGKAANAYGSAANLYNNYVANSNNLQAATEISDYDKFKQKTATNEAKTNYINSIGDLKNALGKLKQNNFQTNFNAFNKK